MSNDKDLLEVLLMPIDVVKGNNSIKIVNGRIKSTQSYRGSDPDMSDAAVEFYQIVYGRRIEKNGVLADDEKNFCGDTMMSSKSLKRLYSLENIEDKTHCLANFWILPMDVGHSSPWTGRRGLMYLSKSAKCCDDMCSFLDFYIKNIESYNKEYSNYVKVFGKDEPTFRGKHMLNDVDYQQLKEGTEGLNSILNKRAQNILEDEERKKEFADIIKSWR